MELSIIMLLILAGCFHSIWNTLAKRSADKQVFLWLSLVVFAIIFFVPLCLLYKTFSSHGWIYIITSGSIHALYMILLGKAYQLGDLSLVYPLSRGSAPLFVTLFAIFFLKEKVSLLGMAGILLIVMGIYTLHIRNLSFKGLTEPLLLIREKISCLALLIGLLISGYSVIDKVGVDYVDPVIYLYLMFAISAILMSPYIFINKSEKIKKEWLENKWAVIAVAIMYVFAYLLVLMAMTHGKVSYISSVREISLVFTTLIGTFMFREAFGGKKIIASILMFSGIVLIALAK